MEDWKDLERYEFLLHDDYSELPEPRADAFEYSISESFGPDPSIDELKVLLHSSTLSPEMNVVIQRMLPILEGNFRDDFGSLYEDACKGMSGGTIDQYKSLNNFAFDLGFVPAERELSPGTHGEMDPRTGIISISPNLSVSQKISVLSHEITHAILHSDPKKTWGKEYDQLEIEAESVAMLMCDHLGVDVNCASEFYIALYMERGIYFPGPMFISIDDEVLEAFNQIKEGIAGNNKDTIGLDFEDIL